MRKPSAASRQNDVQNFVSGLLQKTCSCARDLVIPILLLYAAEILGMMAGSLVYSFLPRQGLSSYLYSLLSPAVYIALLCALTAFYEKKVLHLPPAKPAALSPHQRRRRGLFIAAELASILLTASPPPQQRITKTKEFWNT